VILGAQLISVIWRKTVNHEGRPRAGRAPAARAEGSRIIRIRRAPAFVSGNQTYVRPDEDTRRCGGKVGRWLIETRAPVVGGYQGDRIEQCHTSAIRSKRR
jgi:hypothetical protein